MKVKLYFKFIFIIVTEYLFTIAFTRMGLLSIALLSSVPAFATLLFYGLTLESPRYLCMNGQTSDAHNILEKVAAVNRKELPSGVLISGHKSEQDEEFAPLVDNELSLLAGKEVVVSKTGFSNLLMLFSSKLRRASLLLWVVFFGNAFLSYGLILLTSELSGGQSKCSSSPLHSYNSLNQDANLYTDVFVTSLAGLPGNILSAVIVDRIGRKPSMISMFMFGCIFLLPLVLHQHEIITTGLLFGARMLMVGTFTVANIYASEIYPTGVGVASAVGMISPVVAVQLVTGCHQAAAVLVFEVVLLLSSLSVLFLPFETMGRELADI